MLVTMLAVWKTGAAYLPVDSSYPPEWRAYVLADSGAPILVSSDLYLESYPEFSGSVVTVDGAGRVQRVRAPRRCSKRPKMGHRARQ